MMLSYDGSVHGDRCLDHFRGDKIGLLWYSYFRKGVINHHAQFIYKVIMLTNLVKFRVFVNEFPVQV